MIQNTKLPTDIQDICLFFSEYVTWLMSSGATCIRMEKNVARIAEAWKVDVRMTIMPSHIMICVWDGKHTTSYSNICRACFNQNNFYVNALLSKLSWEIADGEADFQESKNRLKRIVQTPPLDRWVVLVLVSFANAAFCGLFKGDMISILLVFVATMVGYKLKLDMQEDKADIRFIFLCCAFVSSVIASGSYVFGLGNTPDIALGTSVLYLIPGIPYINAVSDMLDGHYICSFSRMMNAAILTFCLSAGLYGGVLVMNIHWF